MRVMLASFLLLASAALQSDTMEHYMNIANQIPQMLLKADPQSQAWARSAQSVLMITNESIAETLLQANDLARTRGSPLFCLPQGVNLDAATLNDMISQTYKDISSQQSDKNKMTVSQVAWLGITKAYPCQAEMPQGMNAFFAAKTATPPTTTSPTPPSPPPPTPPLKLLTDSTPGTMQHVSGLDP